VDANERGEHPLTSNSLSLIFTQNVRATWARVKGYGIDKQGRVLGCCGKGTRETLHMVAIDCSLDCHPFPSKIYEVTTDVFPYVRFFCHLPSKE
jgi:hypothetical protein